MRHGFLGVAAVAVLFAGCTDTGGPGPGIVTVNDDYFTPGNVHPMMNGKVTWVWNGNNAHNVIFDDGIGNSGIYSNGGYHERTFVQDGIYPYRCTLHASMVGRVEVP